MRDTFRSRQRFCASPALQTGRLIWPSECRRLPALSGIEWMALLSPGEDIRRTEEGMGCGGVTVQREERASVNLHFSRLAP